EWVASISHRLGKRSRQARTCARGRQMGCGGQRERESGAVPGTPSNERAQRHEGALGATGAPAGDPVSGTSVLAAADDDWPLWLRCLVELALLVGGCAAPNYQTAV